MPHDETVKRVAEAMTQRRIDGKWAFAPDGENYACADAAITAVLTEIEGSEYVRDMVSVELRSWGVGKYQIPRATHKVFKVIRAALRGDAE